MRYTAEDAQRHDLQPGEFNHTIQGVYTTRLY